MLILESRGKRSIPDERIVFVFRDHAPGRYCPATLVLDDGTEVTGLALKDALDQVERRIAADRLPPAA